jgi:hypothetical protein
MQITLDIPEELFTKLGLLDQSVSQVLELGVNELIARPQPGFTGFAEVLDFLAICLHPKKSSRCVHRQPSKTKSIAYPKNTKFKTLLPPNSRSGNNTNILSILFALRRQKPI